jgi:hypothetical protein
MSIERTELQQQVVEALLDSKAIDLEVVGSVISKFGERAAREGETLVHIVNQRFQWACGWPGPELDIAAGRLNRQIVE